MTYYAGSHEWAFIKTRWTPQGNGVKVLRCMNCRCEKHVRHNGTGMNEYLVPGGTLSREMPVCPNPPKARPRLACDEEKK